jgi:DNA-binding PadR family transcriptional regulator
VRGPLKFDEGRRGARGRGLIQLFILHSLHKEPKSGYDLIKEITEKTGGAWVPSKGTLYSLLKKMEEEGLIIVSDTGKRSKNIFSLTAEGEETLDEIVRVRMEEREDVCIQEPALRDLRG